MSLAIYKSGQGYWTRLLSGVGVGVLVLAGVAWLWGELGAVGTGRSVISASSSMVSQNLAEWGRDQNLPIANIATIRKIDVQVGPGNQPTGFTLTDLNGQTFSLTPANMRVLMNRVAAKQSGNTAIEQPDPPANVRVDQQTIKFETEASWAYTNRLYIQAGVSVGIILVFGALVYYLLNKPNIVDFMIATEAEMKKVNWPTKREVMGSTWIVICGTVMMAVLLLVVDLAFAEGFVRMHVLEGNPPVTEFFKNLFGG